MRFRTILLFCVLVFFYSCKGQNTSKAVVADILVGDTVQELGDHLMHVFQDSRNNYWFGSWGEGAYRYDGNTIIHFTTRNGLPGNRVDGIQEDASGNILLNTDKGICKFDGQAITTINVSKIRNDWKLQPGDLWFSTPQDTAAVYRYDGKLLYRLELPKTKAGDEYLASHPRDIYPYNTFSPYDVYHIYTDKKGNVWFGTAQLGVCRYDGKSHDWLYEEHLTSIKGGGSFGIRSILEDRKGKFWICNTSYQYDMLPGSEKNRVNYQRIKGVDHSKILAEQKPVYYLSILEDKNGVIWMTTYADGVYRYDPSVLAGEESITHYMVTNGDTAVNLYSIYRDRQDNLWLGTHDDGAYKFNGKTFERFRP